MELELAAYTTNTLKANKNFLLGKPIEFYNQDSKREYIEKTLLEQTIKQALKRNTKLYRIKDRTETLKDIVCLFAISVGNIEVKDKNIPSVIIDYFILNNKYRGQINKDNGYTLGMECFSEILALISNISDRIGIRYIILEPMKEEEELINFYKKFGFEFIPVKGSKWMYLDIERIR